VIIMRVFEKYPRFGIPEVRMAIVILVLINAKDFFRVVTFKTEGIIRQLYDIGALLRRRNSQCPILQPVTIDIRIHNYLRLILRCLRIILLGIVGHLIGPMLTVNMGFEGVVTVQTCHPAPFAVAGGIKAPGAVIPGHPGSIYPGTVRLGVSRFDVMTRGAPVFFARLKGRTICHIDALFPIPLGHGRTVKGTPRAVAVIAYRGIGQSLLGIVYSEKGIVVPVVAIITGHGCPRTSGNISCRVGGMTEDCAGPSRLAVATFTSGPDGPLVVELIRGMLVTQVTLRGPHGTRFVFRMNLPSIVVPVVGSRRMADLADAVVKGVARHIGPEYGRLGISAEGPFNCISYQPKVGGLLALGGAVASIMANGAIGDIVVFCKKNRSRKGREGENR
jgi:hypothetical protein